MKIATWNVNSIRARLPRVLAWLEAARPDAACLQELKCTDEAFPRAEIEAAGYRAAVFGQKTYNGVALLARTEPTDVVRGLDDGVEDPQSRVLAGTVAGVRVVCVYAPNGQEVGAPAYGYKLDWFRRLRGYLDRRHRPEEKLVVCGDFNIAPEARDVYNPAALEGQVLCSQPERDALANLCAFGLADTFRKHHAEAGLYSWWDYRMLGFPKNHGLRIDHLLATPPMLAACTAAGIDREARKGKQPSDHAPVTADFS